MERPSRARRHFHTIRFAKKRRAQARRLDSPWAERPLGRFADEQLLGCRRARCDLCHPSKRIRVLLEIKDATAMNAPHGIRTPSGAAGADVLSALMPSQMPVWEPSSAAGSTTIIGDVRAACRQCGTHVKTTINRTTLGGNCTNCGSHELELLKM